MRFNTLVLSLMCIAAAAATTAYAAGTEADFKAVLAAAQAAETRLANSRTNGCRPNRLWPPHERPPPPAISTPRSNWRSRPKRWPRLRSRSRRNRTTPGAPPSFARRTHFRMRRGGETAPPIAISCFWEFDLDRRLFLHYLASHSGGHPAASRHVTDGLRGRRRPLRRSAVSAMPVSCI